MNKAERNYLVGFIAHFLSPQKGYFGGLLVTDMRGVPREFRHSEGVRPTRIQAALYGDSLEASIGGEALAPALFSSLNLQPDLLLVDKESRLLFGQYAHEHAPSALLVPLADPDLAFADSLCVDGSLLDARDYDLKGSTSERVYAYIQENGGNTGAQILELAQKRMNLMSPFSRIRTVLAEIAQVEQGRARK